MTNHLVLLEFLLTMCFRQVQWVWYLGHQIEICLRASYGFLGISINSLKWFTIRTWKSKNTNYFWSKLKLGCKLLFRHIYKPSFQLFWRIYLLKGIIKKKNVIFSTNLKLQRRIDQQIWLPYHLFCPCSSVALVFEVGICRSLWFCDILSHCKQKVAGCKALKNSANIS